MKPNLTKAKLRSGECAVGCLIRYPEPGLVQYLSYLGWDFLVLDAEHGPLDRRDCENLVRAAETNRVTPLVRVPANQSHVILGYLDTGALGVQVPWINNAHDAASAVQSVKFQPQGDRGLAGTRAADYGQRETFAEYIKSANEETLVVAQIESPLAIRNIQEIVRVPGIDVVFIGPTDLSNSYGAPSNLEHEEVRKALTIVTEAVLASDKALGILVTSIQAAREWRRRGARYILTNVEAIVGPACRDFVQKAHANNL